VKPKPSPATQCHGAPNFLSRSFLHCLHAVREPGGRGRRGGRGALDRGGTPDGAHARALVSGASRCRAAVALCAHHQRPGGGGGAHRRRRGGSASRGRASRPPPRAPRACSRPLPSPRRARSGRRWGLSRPVRARPVSGRAALREVSLTGEEGYGRGTRMGNGRGGGSSSTVAVSWALRLVLPRHPPRAQRAERGSRRRQAARAHKVAGPPRDGSTQGGGPAPGRQHTRWRARPGMATWRFSTR